MTNSNIITYLHIKIDSRTDFSIPSGVKLPLKPGQYIKCQDTTNPTTVNQVPDGWNDIGY